MEITFTKNNHSKLSALNFKNISFGKHFADYMFTATYKNGQWSNASIRPYESFKISPACGALHYGQSVYEGMKAFRQINDKVALFRPKENIERLAISAKRMCMPIIPSDFFSKSLDAIVSKNKEWVPPFEDGSMYIRPFLFASEPVLGVRPASEYTFVIFCVPVGLYYDKPLKLKVTKAFSRAAKDGVGYVKTSGNYASALYPAMLAKEEGYDQLIWTDSLHHEYIEEAGTMNLMFVKKNKIITPSLEKNTILKGITRKSLLEIAIKEFDIEVEERDIKVSEIKEGIKNGSITEAFGTGTAAAISLIESICIDDEDLVLPKSNTSNISIKLKDFLENLRSGKTVDTYNWMHYIN